MFSPLTFQRLRADFRSIRFALCLLFLSGALLASCARPSEPPATPAPATLAPSLPVILTPFYTPTLTPTLEALFQASNEPAQALETPVPSATPVTYAVKGGDTMLGIALRYGISLEALKTANPGVDPRAMSVGALLIIPLTQAPAAPTPSPTPLPLQLSAPQCYPKDDGGLWCLMIASNDQAMSFENLSAQVSLYGTDGTMQAERTAFSLLNLLPPGGKIPLLVEFPAPVDPAWRARARLLDALPVDASSSRYLAATIEGLDVDTAAGGQFARLQGEVHWAVQPSAPRLIWLVAVAYDEGDQVVGARRIEILQPCGVEPQGENTPAPAVTPAACVSTGFDLTIYSMGAAIRRVEALVEALP